VALEDPAPRKEEVLKLISRGLAVEHHESVTKPPRAEAASASDILTVAPT
jgi:hypothetical protein